MTLNEDQRRIVEQLAANTHEVWAAKRIAEGWKIGSQRDDSAKTHPCLVPYDELPESEKDYDRDVVEQVLKAAIALGFPFSSSRL